MDEEDELALKAINSKLPAGQDHCSEDQFEEVMNFFEETAQTKQPFAAVDSPPVLPLEELQEQIDDTVPPFVRGFSAYFYEHWKTRRTATGNRGLAPRLKFETGQETDDSDPYVCFRRRELRQIRKTRNRDAQSAEKLRKLRLELETARAMLLMVKRREQLRKESLEVDRMVFEQRLSFRDTKRKLGIKGDDELLINQKVIPTLFKKMLVLTTLAEAEVAAWHDPQPSRSRSTTQDAYGSRPWSRASNPGRHCCCQRPRDPEGDSNQHREAYPME